MNKIFNISGTLLLTAILLLTAACSSDSSNDVQPSPTPNTSQEISLIPTVWQMAEATRATMYNDDLLRAENSGFTCTAYTAKSTTVNGEANINGTSVTWNDTRWEIADGPHPWPVSDALDFFAYAPKSGSLPSYITSGPTYTTARNPQFTCGNLPMTYNSASPTEGQGSGLQEFVYALKTDRTKDLDGANGVTLNFQHPFTKIILKLSSTQEDIRINTITLKTIKKNGSYTHSSAWTPTGDATDFVATLNANYTANDNIGTFLMIPQEWEGVIEVNATWNVWGEPKTNTVSKDLEGTINWQRGYSYTYTFNITETDLVVNTSKYTEQW